MLGGSGAAYVMLKSITTPNGMLDAIATISETGNDILKIKVIAVPPNSDQRHHNQWWFGPGVAVETYIDPSERPHPVDRFDEYDVTTGDRVATKTAPLTGFQLGCYLGNEFSMLAHSAHADPARQLSPDTPRLVTSRETIRLIILAGLSSKNRYITHLPQPLYDCTIFSSATRLRITSVAPFDCMSCFFLNSEKRRLTVSRVVPMISAISSCVSVNFT